MNLGVLAKVKNVPTVIFVLSPSDYTSERILIILVPMECLFVRKSRSGDDLRIRIASKSDTDNFEPSFELDILDTSDEMPPRHEQLEPALGVSRRGTGSQACLG